jgi:hypothetical protein
MATIADATPSFAEETNRNKSRTKTLYNLILLLYMLLHAY